MPLYRSGYTAPYRLAEFSDVPHYQAHIIQLSGPEPDCWYQQTPISVFKAQSSRVIFQVLSGRRCLPPVILTYNYCYRPDKYLLICAIGWSRGIQYIYQLLRHGALIGPARIAVSDPVSGLWISDKFKFLFLIMTVPGAIVPATGQARHSSVWMPHSRSCLSSQRMTLPSRSARW